MDGREFLRRMHAGDASAWDAIMPMLRSLAFGACRDLGIHDSLKDDIVQDVALRVFTHWRTYQAESALSTWIYSIARNRCLDELRKRTIRGERTRGARDASKDDEAAPEVDPGFDPKFELMLCIQQLLAELDAQGPARRNSHRTADVLRYWVEHGPTMEELAHFLGKPTAQAAKQRIYEMRKQIEQFCLRYCGHHDCSFLDARSRS